MLVRDNYTAIVVFWTLNEWLHQACLLYIVSEFQFPMKKALFKIILF